MDMLLNDRWEWFYENRLKHPSEEEEENVQKIDYHLVIKKNGIMFVIEIAIKVLEKAKAYSKDGHFVFSYVFSTRAEKMMNKMKQTQPAIMNNSTHKKLYLNVLEMCQTFKEKAKENIMETLLDDIKEEQAERKKAEANIINIEQKIGLDNINLSDNSNNTDTALDDNSDLDDYAFFYDDLDVNLNASEKNVEVYDFINDGRGKQNDNIKNNENCSNDSSEIATAVVINSDDNGGGSINSNNVIAIEPNSIVLNENSSNNILIVEDANVLEINPDAPPDMMYPVTVDSSNFDDLNSDGVSIVATASGQSTDKGQAHVYVGTINEDTSTTIEEEAFDTSTFTNLYGNPKTNDNSPLVQLEVVDTSKNNNKNNIKNVTKAMYVEPSAGLSNISGGSTSVDGSNRNSTKQSKFVVKPIQVIEKLKWRVGDKIDIEDVFMSKQGAGVLSKWRKGRIISIKDNRRIKVRYIEPPFNKPKWDENIDMRFEKQKCRIAKLGTYTKSLDLQWMSKTERFKVGMRNNGYSIYQMRGDGNCLFRSVAHQIWNNAERHADLRRAVCDHMLQHPGQFSEVLGALMPGPNGFARYVERMRYPCQGGQGEWGGDPEIRVMEELLDRPIEVWDVESGPEAPSNIHLEGSLPDYVLNEVAPIRISYHGKNHYNSVIYDKDMHKYPYGLPRTTLIRDFRKKIEREERRRDARLKNGYK